MNPPHEGENRRTAGVFLWDEARRFYIGHTGKLGGRLGGGQGALRKFAQDLAWQEIATRKFAIIGPVQDRGLIDGFARYVRRVAKFKDSRRDAAACLHE